MIATTTANRAWIRVGAVIIGTTVLAAAGLIGCTKHLATLSRPEEPVTIDGSALPSLLGTDPDHVVAFAWDSTAWTQVPVQVDQRDRVNPGQILHRATASWATLPDGSPFTPLVYTPPATTSAGYTSWGTYTPPDSDPLLDGDDEVTFLADDSGVRATSATPSDPPGVDAATRQEVAVTDPLAPDQHGYVYLFHSDTSTGGSAGTTGVSYTFSLDSGSYLATYKMGNGALAPNRAAGFNPEHSTITTGAYAQTYTDR
ncbi:MAG: hypothetical protein ACXWCM_09390, partial [Acidimicrobiales bacterium]